MSNFAEITSIEDVKNLSSLNPKTIIISLMRDVKSLEVEFPDDLEIANFVSDLNPLLAEAIGLRNQGLSLKDYLD